MNRSEEQAIRKVGKWPYALSIVAASIFAVLGAAFLIMSGNVAFWGIWIPFCFFVIPLIHHLAKKVSELEDRIKKLEEETPQPQD